MNRKGFTLVELMISISLLSIVLIFMMNTLVKLRDTNLAEGEDTNLLVGQAIISKTINSDILTNGGISSYTCLSNLVTLVLGNGEERRIELNEQTTNLNANTVLTYRNPADTEAILVRKTPDKYLYSAFTCDNVNGVIRIRVNIDGSSNYSEILYYGG